MTSLTFPKRAKTLAAGSMALAIAAVGLVGGGRQAKAAALPVPMHTVGIFRGSGNPAGVHDFENRAMGGRKAPLVLEHGAYSSWNDIESPGWFLSLWQGTGYKLAITVDMLPPGATMQAAANGDYDAHWRIQLQKFVSYGFPDAILRVGHEFNCCYTWNAASDPAAYIAMYRRYVSVARSIPGQNFLFDWNAILGDGNIAAERAYPGDDVVDIIGLDVYDDNIFGSDPATRWNNTLNAPHGLIWHRDFAAAHGKMMSFPEWGVDNRPQYPNRSGGDNPYFIQKMHDWINSNNVLYADSYNDDNSDYQSDMLDGHFPNSLGAFTQAFSSSAPASTPNPVAPTTTSTTAPASGHATLVAPAAPANLSASTSGNTVNLSWVPAPGADGYNIFRDGVQIAWPLNSSLAAWTDTPTGTGSHSYYVRGYNGAGNGAATATVTVTVSGASSTPTTAGPVTSTTMPAGTPTTMPVTTPGSTPGTTPGTTPVTTVATPASTPSTVPVNSLGNSTTTMVGDPTTTTSAPSTQKPADAAAPKTTSSGYWMLGTDGKVYAFGNAQHFDKPVTLSAGAKAISLAPTADHAGYWILDNHGGVQAFGDAPVLGSIKAGSLHAGEEASSLSLSASGRGYWIFTTEGRVFTFGDAAFFGDMGGVKLNGPVVSSVPTTSGNGYYMVGSDGGIFAFGDATFRGSMGGRPLNQPIRSLVPTAKGAGYWLVASDGGIFAFGDATFRGSMGGKTLNKPVVGMVRSGTGYMMVASDGGIFNFSDQAFLGSLGSTALAAPVTAVATA